VHGTCKQCSYVRTTYLARNLARSITCLLKFRCSSRKETVCHSDTDPVWSFSVSAVAKLECLETQNVWWRKINALKMRFEESSACVDKRYLVEQKRRNLWFMKKCMVCWASSSWTTDKRLNRCHVNIDFICNKSARVCSNFLYASTGVPNLPLTKYP